jgi:hypothetical protein
VGDRDTAAVGPGRFATDTAVEQMDRTRYRGIVDPGWAVIDGAAPNGGYLLAIAARALRGSAPPIPTRSR